MFLCCLIVKVSFEREFHVCYISMLLRKEEKNKVVPSVHQCYIKQRAFITYLDAYKHKCILDVFRATVVLNNYEQVGWVLNLGAQCVHNRTVTPTPGPRGKRGERRQ